MSRNRGIFFILLIGAAVILSVAWGILSRQDTLASLRVTADQEAVPPVQVMYPQYGSATHALDLPGNVVPWYEAPIYAQVSGYVKMWYADYGAVVKRGQVLATINAPELDEQYQAAKAQLAVAQSRYDIAALTAKRYSALSGHPSCLATTGRRRGGRRCCTEGAGSGGER